MRQSYRLGQDPPFPLRKNSISNPLFLFDGFPKVTKETGWISHHLVLMLVTSSTQEVTGNHRETGQQETKHLGVVVMGEETMALSQVLMENWVKGMLLFSSVELVKLFHGP